MAGNLRGGQFSPLFWCAWKGEINPGKARMRSKIDSRFAQHNSRSHILTVRVSAGSLCGSGDWSDPSRISGDCGKGGEAGVGRVPRSPGLDDDRGCHRRRQVKRVVDSFEIHVQNKNNLIFRFLGGVGRGYRCSFSCVYSQSYLSWRDIFYFDCI